MSLLDILRPDEEIESTAYFWLYLPWYLEERMQRSIKQSAQRLADSIDGDIIDKLKKEE